jgi:ABC-type Fe3+-hydroxamate transport system substrate-binding protein
MPVLRFSHRLIVGIGLAAIACTSSRDTAGSGVLRDDYGDPIVMGASPRRIVSLNPTTTEALFAMGASAHLIGRSHWDAWPDSARRIPDLGDALRPNVEAVLAAHPDLVIVYASLDNRAATQRLRAAGVNTVAFKIDRLADFDRTTRLLGRVIGDSARAAWVADSVRSTITRVRVATARLEHPTVIWPFSYRPVMVVGGGSFMSELLDVAGGRNIYGDLPQPSPVVTLEDVVRRNPDYVIRSIDVTQSVTQPQALDPAWTALAAVRMGRVISAPAELVARPSVRLGEAAVAL